MRRAGLASVVTCCSHSDMARQRTLCPVVGTLSRADAPYPTPPAGGQLRLAFVGQSTYFRASALDEHSRRLETRFIEFRAERDAERMRAALDGFAPHAVVVFRPEIVPAGTFADLRVPVV